jgi:hypothetical protein
MSQDKPLLFEYSKHYPSISFSVSYSYWDNNPKELYYSAQPLEHFNGLVATKDFIYGMIDEDFQLQVGIREFQIVMTQQLHDRMGSLYDIIRNEYVDFINKHL